MQFLQGSNHGGNHQNRPSIFRMFEPEVSGPSSTKVYHPSSEEDGRQTLIDVGCSKPRKFRHKTLQIQCAPLAVADMSGRQAFPKNSDVRHLATCRQHHESRQAVNRLQIKTKCTLCVAPHPASQRAFCDLETYLPTHVVPEGLIGWRGDCDMSFVNGQREPLPS